MNIYSGENLSGSGRYHSAEAVGVRKVMICFEMPRTPEIYLPLYRGSFSALEIYIAKIAKGY